MQQLSCCGQGFAPERELVRELDLPARATKTDYKTLAYFHKLWLGHCPQCGSKVARQAELTYFGESVGKSSFIPPKKIRESLRLFGEQGRLSLPRGTTFVIGSRPVFPWTLRQVPV